MKTPITPATTIRTTCKSSTTFAVVASAAGCATGVITIITAVAKAIGTARSQSMIADQIVSDIMVAHPDIVPDGIRRAVYSEMKLNKGFTDLPWEDRGPIAERVIKKLEKALQK